MISDPTHNHWSEHDPAAIGETKRRASILIVFPRRIRDSERAAKAPIPCTLVIPDIPVRIFDFAVTKSPHVFMSPTWVETATKPQASAGPVPPQSQWVLSNGPGYRRDIVYDASRAMIQYILSATRRDKTFKGSADPYGIVVVDSEQWRSCQCEHKREDERGAPLRTSRLLRRAARREVLGMHKTARR